MTWLWTALAFVIMIGGTVARTLLDRWHLLPGYVKNALDPVPLMIVGYYCAYLAKRHYARMELDAAAGHPKADDKRPPVVYLRSFEVDKHERPLHLSPETLEEVLKSVFSQIGPFVALGRPGEKFPTLGADRTYVADGWETYITDLMSRARLVVLLPGKTEGLLYEVEWATRSLRPEQLLIVVPSGRKDYEEFRSEARFPRPLPEYPAWKISRANVKGLIYFEPDWTAHFLTFKLMFLRGRVLHPLPLALQAALRPVFARLGVPWRPPSINWVRLLLLGLLAAALLYDLYQRVR